MIALNVRNVNHALPQGLALLRDQGKAVAPRGKLTLEFDGVVATEYQYPDEMVLFDPIRDANPFFHFFEALWVLNGREDVEFLARFNSNISQFSDDGIKFHAPYGYRLRHAHGFDQIENAISTLKLDNDSRQVVMSIWDPNLDMAAKSKDIPCNDLIMLKVREGKLRMTVCCRSNDIVWGAYGANVTQFSTLLLYLAGRIGVKPGKYTQISDSYHVYTDLPFWKEWLELHQYGVPPPVDPYQLQPSSESYLATTELETGDFDYDLNNFFDRWDEGLNPGDPRVYDSPSFKGVVAPMYEAHTLWKEGQRKLALASTGNIEAWDWRTAVEYWMQRRIDKQGA